MTTRYRGDISRIDADIQAAVGLQVLNEQFAELARLVDPAKEDFDHQLINIDLTLTTAEGHVAGLEQRLQEAGGKLFVEDDDF
jgi:hypothetical protein